jgi:hypothetical protein
MMRLPTKMQVFANFLPQKMLQPSITPHAVWIYLHQTNFLFPKLKIKLKGPHFAGVAEIQEAITDELQKVQKEEFSALFRKFMTAQKPVYEMPLELTLNLKKGYVSSSYVFNF